MFGATPTFILEHFSSDYKSTALGAIDFFENM
jgi:hypothetical protein